MEITGVDFISIPTRDIEASVAFYSGVLGLPLAVHMPDEGFAEFEAGNVTINIHNPQMMGMQHRVNENAIALRVDDVAAAREELEAKGVEFAAATLDTSVCHMAFFTDPDGNALVLHRRYAPRVSQLD